MSESSKRRRVLAAFTLIELLVVIAIIMLLAGLLFPMLSAAREKARKVKAQAEVKQLEIAWKSVLSDYRTWTLAGINWADGNPHNMEQAEVRYLQGNPSAGGNSKGINYMEFPAGTTNFMDPWKKTSPNQHVYRVCLGADNIRPYAGLTLYRSVAAWSKGPDDRDSNAADQKDDVRSWE